VLSLSALTLAPGAVRADQEPLVLVIPGYLYSAGFGSAPASGYGVELSVLHVFDTNSYFGIGALGQWQSYRGEGENHSRIAVAGEAVFGPFGLELGYAQRGGDGVHDAQDGAHVAPFFCIGIVSLAYRMTVPLGGGEGRYGFEHALALGLKLPIPISGWRGLIPPFPVTGHGRPLRDSHGDAVLPRVIDRRTTGRLPRDRARWIAEARMEYASIESFLRLADDLDALGAPASLVARALVAAEEERRHAETCLELAGGSLSLADAAPRRPRRRVDRALLAREAFFDGVLGEGRAALEIAGEARATKSAALARIAAEEAAHARLSADVLAFVAHE